MLAAYCRWDLMYLMVHLPSLECGLPSVLMAIPATNQAAISTEKQA